MIHERPAPARRLLARNILVLEEGAAAVRALRDDDVEAIVLKGAALVDVVYTPEERPMEDVDLLVPAAKLRRAHAAIERRGFRRVTLRARPVGNRLHHACAYAAPAGTHIDLHTSLAHPVRWRLDHASLFRRATVLELADGTRALRLSPEDHLVHAAVTLAGDELVADGRTAEDIRRIVDHFDIDWDALVARAREAACTVALWLALKHARAHAGAAVPPGIERALAPPRPRRAYLEWLLRPGASSPYRFSGHGKRLRQALAGAAVTDSPWRFGASALRFAALRAIDASLTPASTEA